MSTYQDLKDRAQNMALVEDDTLAGIFVNDVYRDLVVQGQLRCTSVEVPIAQTENLYTLTDDFGVTDLGMLQYFIYTAAGQTEGYILDQTDLETVLQLSSTLPTGYVRKYAFQGLENVYLWPYPQNGTRYAGTNLLVHDNTLTSTFTGLAQNAVVVTNVTSWGPNTYQLTTATNHGFTAGDTVFIGIPHNYSGHQLTDQSQGYSAADGNLNITGLNTFRVDRAGVVSTGAVTSGGATNAPAKVSIYGTGQPGFTTNLVVLSGGLSYGYTPLANALSYGTDGVWAYLLGGDTLTLYYAQEPTELALAADEPTFVPTQWQHLISIGAAARLTDAVGEDIALASALQTKYDALYSVFVKWVKNRQGRGTQIMASGYSRAVGWPPHDRSAYYSPNVSNY